MRVMQQKHFMNVIRMSKKSAERGKKVFLCVKHSMSHYSSKNVLSSHKNFLVSLAEKKEPNPGYFLHVKGEK